MKPSSAVLIPAALLLAWGATRVARPARAEAPPAGEPTLFAPGVISTTLDETGASFTPDGGTVYFARRSPTTTSTPVQAIFVSRRAGDRWTPPEIAPFSGRWSDFAPSVSPDGARIFFSSLRPRPGASESRPDADIWVVERAAGGGWNEPRVLDAPVNSDSNDAYACQAADGTLYFASDRPGGAGGTDIYRAAPSGSGWAAPENVGAGVNTPGYESQPAVAPDQTFLVFTALGRADIPLTGGSPYARGDLYVSVRRDGAFQAARNLGPAVNSTATESNPSLAPDGKSLFFTSERGFAKIPMDAGLTREGFEQAMRGIFNGRGNIYEVRLAKIGLPEGEVHP
jgi:Tol biopolymer transport system component